MIAATHLKANSHWMQNFASRQRLAVTRSSASGPHSFLASTMQTLMPMLVKLLPLISKKQAMKTFSANYAPISMRQM
ncbi:hypothetical protein D3C80_2145390 [compost metagenome]